MIALLIIIAIGFCMGRLFLPYRLSWLSAATTVTVWLLLFLLGTAVGTDDRIFEGMTVFGSIGLVIAVAGVTGSCVLAWVLWKWTSSSSERESAAEPEVAGCPSSQSLFAGLLSALIPSLIIVLFFAAGVFAGRFAHIRTDIFGHDLSLFALGLLLLFVGMGMGHEDNIFRQLKALDRRLLLLPVATIAGTLVGCGLLWTFLPVRPLTDFLAVGSGFGYYSLSSVFLTEYRGADMGIIALLANVAREIITLLGAPLLRKIWGPLAPVTAGGATSMDTTLPVITQVSGNRFAILSVYHGFIVDSSVPLLVSFFCLV